MYGCFWLYWSTRTMTIGFIFLGRSFYRHLVLFFMFPFYFFLLIVYSVFYLGTLERCKLLYGYDGY